MEFIDTHSHLYSEEFNEDRNEVIQKAFANNVNKIILPAIDSKSHQSLIDLSGQYSGQLFPLIGLHPTSVNDNYKEELAIVESYLSSNTLFYGIGEIGIDLYWEKSHKAQQIEAFKIQVNWAKQLNLPIVIHTRDSFDEVYNILKPLADENLKGIFHCFGGSLEQAKLITDIGFLLGIGGVLTFKNSNLSDVIKHVDIKHLVLETDSPYLSPVPKRGKRNESSNIALVANKLSEVCGLSLQTVAKQTTDNANKMFAL